MAEYKYDPGKYLPAESGEGQVVAVYTVVRRDKCADTVLLRTLTKTRAERFAEEARVALKLLMLQNLDIVIRSEYVEE